MKNRGSFDTLIKAGFYMVILAFKSFAVNIRHGINFFTFVLNH